MKKINPINTNIVLMILVCLLNNTYAQHTLVTDKIATSSELTKEIGKWREPGETLSINPLNRNGRMQQGNNAGGTDGRPTGWIMEITSGETTGYWQTPTGPNEKTVTFLYVNRGYQNWSKNDVRIVPAKPPKPEPNWTGHCIQLFPWFNELKEETTVTTPAIGVRQGEASYTCESDIKMTAQGAILIRAEAWVPDHRIDLGEKERPQRPSVYLTADLLAGNTTIGEGAEIRIPVDLNEFEQWKPIRVRLSWRQTNQKLFVEWRVFGPDGKLILPSEASASTRFAHATQNGVESYSFNGREGEQPWSAVMVIDNKTPKAQAITEVKNKLRVKAIAGSWMAANSTNPYFPMCGEAYIRNLEVREVTSPHYH